MGPNNFTSSYDIGEIILVSIFVAMALYCRYDQYKYNQQQLAATASGEKPRPVETPVAQPNSPSGQQGAVVQPNPEVASANAPTNPLEQFEVTLLPGFESIGFTNLALTMALNLAVLFFFLGLYTLSLSNGYDVTLRSIYQLVASMVKENLYMAKQIYFTVLFYLFIFILAANVVGMIPYSFTSTSSFAVTFFLSCTHFVGLNHVGATQHG
jgi:hypothetical protein